MYGNQVYPLETLEEMQRDAMEKNNEKTDRLCKCDWLCVCWSFVLILSCYIIVFATVILISSSLENKGNEQLKIIKEYLESGSGSY